jgi:hypothetical protein
MKYISKIGAYNCAVGVEIQKVMQNYYNPDLILFRWPNGEGLWLEENEWEETEE